jgi:hypothetical protein
MKRTETAASSKVTNTNPVEKRSNLFKKKEK